MSGYCLWPSGEESDSESKSRGTESGLTDERPQTEGLPVYLVELQGNRCPDSREQKLNRARPLQDLCPGISLLVSAYLSWTPSCPNKLLVPLD